MNVIANWQLSLDGVGTAAVYQYEFGYSGGFVVVGLGDGDQFAVCSLGNSEIALAVGMHDDTKNKDYTLYWNSHYPATSGYDANGMMLWYAPSDLEYISDTVGPEQTFKVANLGNGTVSLQATAGAFGGQYLSGELGGAYPNEWGFGSGVVVSSASPTAFQVGGDLLALLQITNSGYRTDLHGRDFGTIDLTGANLRECILDGANLTKIAAMKGADFTGAHLRGANLGGLDLSNAATWSQADFTGSDLRAIAGAPAAQLPGAVLDGADLSGRNLAGANLQGAKLRGTVLTGTNLTGAHLDGADLTGAKLGGTILHGASMLGTHFDKVDLTTAQFDPAPSFTRAVTSRTTFVGATVPFPVLAANWSYLDLSGATLTNLPKTIASLVADHVLLPDGQDFSGLDLTGASFAGARMYEAQLVRTNLHGASLRGALLKGAKLVGANLTLADLDSAYLIAEQTAGGLLELDKTEAAVVSDAYLFNTILDGAHCDGVDFSGSTFVTASSLSSSQSASAVGASMNFAKFDDAQAVLAVFNGAQLSAASFASATLVSASFQDNGSSATQLTPSSDSTHTPASVYKADLRGTNFTGANMDGLDMREASYSTSSGEFEKLYDGFGGTKVPVAFRYAATQLGVTTAATTCPDGHDGPCTLRA